MASCSREDFFSHSLSPALVSKVCLVLTSGGKETGNDGCGRSDAAAYSRRENKKKGGKGGGLGWSWQTRGEKGVTYVNLIPICVCPT